MLTKSLHTITAATNVARYLLESARDRGVPERSLSDVTLAARALTILGYDSEDYADPTVQKIISNCAKLLAAAERPTVGTLAQIDAWAIGDGAQS